MHYQKKKHQIQQADIYNDFLQSVHLFSFKQFFLIVFINASASETLCSISFGSSVVFPLVCQAGAFCGNSRWKEIFSHLSHFLRCNRYVY